MAIKARWRVHPLHLYLIRRYLRLEDLTLPLEGPAYGHDEEQLAEVALREQPTMEQLGLLADEEVDPNLVTALKALIKPYFWLDSLWYPSLDSDHSWRSVSVRVDQERTVLGVQAPGETEHYGGLLTVEVHEKATLSQTLLPTLPPAPPGNQQAVKVPASSFRPASSDEHDVLDEFSGQTSSSGDRQLQAFHAISRAPHVRGGQFTANLRNSYGKITRSNPVRWFDNAEPDGRYLNDTSRTSTGEQLHVLLPADARVLGSKIEEVAHSVHAQR